MDLRYYARGDMRKMGGGRRVGAAACVSVLVSGSGTCSEEV